MFSNLCIQLEAQNIITGNEIITFRNLIIEFFSLINIIKTIDQEKLPYPNLTELLNEKKIEFENMTKELSKV